MTLERSCVTVLSLVLALGLTAGTAQALDFSLTGGGGQMHIGGGLPLPIQPGVPNFTATPTKFPSLLIPVKGGPAPIITGTVAKPFQSVGGKKGYQRRLHVPAGVLTKPAAQTTLGLFTSNPSLLAVATNLSYAWPLAPAVFSTGAVGPAVVLFDNGSMTYSNALASRFGGPAQFGISPGPLAATSGILTVPVTIYLQGGTASPPPPCVGCFQGIMGAFPTAGGGPFGAGGATPTTVMTDGIVLAPNVAQINVGLTPPGTILGTPVLVATNPAVPTNMATSQGAPWTTGKIVISQPNAIGAPEKFTLSGRDDRTARGGGSIQLVSGALSKRTASMSNANRGWIRLELSPIEGVPSMSWVGLAATAGLMMLTAGYIMRKRILA